MPSFSTDHLEDKDGDEAPQVRNVVQNNKKSFDKKFVREYKYNNQELSDPTYDVNTQQKVGYGHMQKTNLFHRVGNAPKQEFTVEVSDPLT